MTKPSYCLEALTALQKARGYRWEDSHFTVDGIEATLVDESDGQRYTLELRPLRTGKGVQGDRG